MTPPVKDYSSYIPSRIESRSCKHLGELFADSSLIIPESGREQFLAAKVTLFLRGVTRMGVQNFQGEDDGRIRADLGIPHASECEFAHLHIVAGSFKPAAAGHPHVVQKSPVPHRHISHHARRAVELRISPTV